MKTLFLLLLATVAFSQSLSKEIDSIYNFKPSKLSRAEQETKLPQLDKFWDKVKNDTLHMLPLLRAELKSERHNPYFYYDGSGLLLTLSNRSNDKKTSIEAISKCNLSDIDRRLFVKNLNDLARLGFDVTKPALKTLNEADYSFAIPQHAMTFEMGECLSYMLLPQKEELYVDTLITLFPSLQPNSQKAIILTLWYGVSCKGDAFIKLTSEDKSIDREVRRYAAGALSDTGLDSDQKYYLKELGEITLPTVRAMALERFSDEALAELELSAKLLRQQLRCD